MRHAFCTMTMMVTITADALPACEKSSSDPGIAPPKDTATAPLTASAPAPAASSAETATPAASVSAPAAASAVASASLAAANGTADAGKAKGAGSASASALKPASRRISGNQFTLDVSSPGCKAGEDCTVTLELTATGEYHVNKEYPYKFIATAAPGVTFLGKTDPNTFTRAAGDFVEKGEKTGLMTVRFKAASPGEAKVSGKYKLSVCSADQCLIEEPVVDLAVPVI